MPEISPELAARIETLKASHAENPARFFMPLASAYREAGEVGKAEDLLRDNLKRHPGYLSAHVLLGRCLADRGAYAEARNGPCSQAPVAEAGQRLWKRQNVHGNTKGLHTTNERSVGGDHHVERP